MKQESKKTESDKNQWDRWIEASVPASAAVLHKAIMMGGKTEATINSNKLPGANLWCLPGTGLFIEYKNIKKFIPDAAVNDYTIE